VPHKKTERGHPSVLGFYKKSDGPEKLLAQVHGDSSALYVDLPTHLRNRLEVVVGSRFVGKLIKVIKQNGERLELQAERVFEVKGHWNEVHLPHEMVREYRLKQGDSAEIILRQITNYGNTRDI